jgi:hypothetical protein
VNCEGPKFLVGDLVMFRHDFMGEMISGLGIIVSEPTLVFVHDWDRKSGFPNEFWSYNVKVDNELFKMIPEQFLRGLKEDVQD